MKSGRREPPLSGRSWGRATEESRRGASPWSQRRLWGKTFVNDSKTINLATGDHELLGTDLTLESGCHLLHIVKHQIHRPPKRRTKLI